MAAPMEEINLAWKTAENVLSPWKNTDLSANKEDGQFSTAVNILCQNGLMDLLEDWFFEALQEDLRERVAPKFLGFFEKKPQLEDKDAEDKAVEYLHGVTQDYKPALHILEGLPRETNRNYSMLAFCGVSTVADVLRILLRAVVFTQATPVFRQCVDHFYSQTFRVFRQHNKPAQEEESEEEVTECMGCQKEQSDCRCEMIRKRFHDTNTKLDEIGLLEQVSGTAVTTLVHEQIAHHWLENKVLVWLKLVYSGNLSNTGSTCIEGFKGRLQHFLWETYARVQIEQLFNIIIEYPESEPAVQDLKTCLEKTDMRGHLVTTLKSALETRLLHPGVNTADILTAYISAIRALRALDPAGVILELVCDPVRKYLRSREDTVRCIVSNLTDDGSNELLEELVKGQPPPDTGAPGEEDADEWRKWMPDPVDADPASASKSRRASDIISMLVNIYGSKELFVNEYRTLLADRILTNFSYEIEKEIRYLELLKLRFGDELHFCEVMLKDVADSKRVNTRITDERKQKGEVEDVEVSAMILSAQFWPAFREEKISLPEHMQALLAQFTSKFEALKGNRTLNWKSHLGLVSMEVELKDRTLNFNVSPVHAAILMQFEQQVPATALRRKIAFWQSQGLLKEETPDSSYWGRGHDLVVGDDEEAESAMASAHAQKEEELQVFWTYIVGMLSNLESLPLERIHSVLRMFAMQGTSGEITLEELNHFLDKKVKDQALAYSGGVYRLPKSS
ncbi:ANC2-like protein [Mya arenaria]|uniref:Anaphase-promoting complex subunit 2 n=1 Tax=Mya arenaria TaxID=6604 RepID=A0ABY7GDM1_MYAAR|nr:ANC2-like protein [Mya arenaria]